MKKFFLAFSIVFASVFAWAQDPVNPGSEPGMQKDGATTTAIGADTGNCVVCRKNTWNGPRDKNTNPELIKIDNDATARDSKNTK